MAMTLLDKLRLTQIKRYAICHTNRDQSVAEHSFNVLLIALELAKHGNVLCDPFEVASYAIDHDMEEVYTGDIPSSFKKMLLKHAPQAKPLVQSPYEVDPAVKGVVKLADYLEAIYYVREFGGSRLASGILNDIRKNFFAECENSAAPKGCVVRAMELEKIL